MYGAKTQYATKDETPPLTAKQCLNIQKVTGSVLYYARAVDPTILMPLNDIATEQTKANEKTQAATNKLLDYLATHPELTQTPPSDIMPQTLYYRSTVMPRTFQYQTHAAVSEACFSSATNPLNKIH
jgi:hypothetical protein